MTRNVMDWQVSWYSPNEDDVLLIDFSVAATLQVQLDAIAKRAPAFGTIRFMDNDVREQVIWWHYGKLDIRIANFA